MQNEGTAGASRENAETTPANGACSTDAKAGGGCSFFKQHRVRVRALNDGPDIARVAVGRTGAPPPEGAAEAHFAHPNSSSHPGDLVQENATGAAPAPQKKSEDPPSSHSHGNLKKKQTTARGDKNRRKERGNEYFGTADPWAARAESTYGPMSRPYSREASYNHRGFWDWSR